MTRHLDNGSIESRLATLLDDLCRAEKECGRKPHGTRLLAISKARTIEEIYAAHKAGQTAFGESYVQEALPKILAPELERLEWHFVGPVQSNKAAKIARHFSWVHSLERVKIAERLNQNRPADAPPLNVCVQINISGETTKSGIRKNETRALLEAVAQLPRLRLRGLMTIAKKQQGETPERTAFTELNALYQELRNDFSLDTLSMGMSADYRLAIAEGATIVRIGSALFGSRK